MSQSYASDFDLLVDQIMFPMMLPETKRLWSYSTLARKISLQWRGYGLFYYFIHKKAADWT
ncbi:hypothetical protein MKY42_14860 [Paenibacillus sp. FSL W7-1088]|uniref:hypothetical protein n=1 Tax=Paenibacillus sp. FSL W7-1088 TaxID=2921695 RepID=UPI0030EE2670